MRFRELVTEATGGLARRWLEKQQGKDIHFLDNTGNRWELDNVSFWPQDPDLFYKTDDTGSAWDKMADEVDGFLDTKRLSSIIEVNQKSQSAAKIAVIVVIVSSKNKRVAYVRYVDHKQGVGSNPITWTNTAFLASTGLTMQSAQMKKAMIPIDPSDIVRPGANYNVGNLISTVTSKVKTMEIADELKVGIPKLLTNVRDGKLNGVPGLVEHKPVIEIKLGEIAAPIALISGNFLTGSYREANSQLLAPMGGNWQNASGISFPPKAEMLIDSYLHFPKGIVGISSKDAKGGAKPSVKIIADTIRDKRNEFKPKFFQEYNDIITNINILNEESAIDGVLTIAKNLRIVDNNDLTYIRSIYGKGNISNKNMTPRLKGLINKTSYQKIDYNHPEYQLGFHILAVLAREVANNFNKDSAKITTFFKTVLNKSNLIQVLARTRKIGDGLAFDQFDVIWPPVFTGSIIVDAGSYTSRTRPSRKIAFGFK